MSINGIYLYNTHTQTMEYYPAPKNKKEGNLAICDVGGPWGHYAEWSQRQTKHDFTYYEELNK